MTPTARQALADLMAQAPNGVLKAAEVVQAATPVDSPLHPYFTWNNQRAAHRFRLVQARALLRSITVVNPEGLHVQPTVAYVSLAMDRTQPGGGYRHISTVLASQALREEYIHSAMRDLIAWLNRYRNAEELVSAVAQAAGVPLPDKVVATLVPQPTP